LAFSPSLPSEVGRQRGTGKTMAAEVLANELRLHLYRIDVR
jgi:AAA+ superfamily predicted ATPase